MRKSPSRGAPEMIVFTLSTSHNTLKTVYKNDYITSIKITYEEVKFIYPYFLFDDQVIEYSGRNPPGVGTQIPPV